MNDYDLDLESLQRQIYHLTLAEEDLKSVINHLHAAHLYTDRSICALSPELETGELVEIYRELFSYTESKRSIYTRLRDQAESKEK